MTATTTTTTTGLPLGEREFLVACGFLALSDLAALAGTCKRFASACASVHVLEQAVEVAVLAGTNPRVPATLLAAHPSLRFSLRYRQAAREPSVAFRQPLGDRQARRLARLVESNGRLQFLRMFKVRLCTPPCADTHTRRWRAICPRKACAT